MNQRNWLLTRLVIILLVTAFISYFYIKDSNQNYQKGIELTKESYMKNYEEYKAELLSSKENMNVFRSTFVVLVSLSVLIGIYEGLIFFITLFLKKGIHTNSPKKSNNKKTSSK
jgi:predicted PurR-regulated permease PerM